MKRNHKFGIGAVLLVGALGYLMYAGVEQGSVYYFTIDEFHAHKANLANQGVRVAGRVTAGSVQRRSSPKGTELKFTLGEFVGDGGAPNGALLPVEFTGVLPDMFAEGRDVIVEGKYVDGTLRAQSVMTSCPSKYESAKGQPQANAGKPAAAN